MEKLDESSYKTIDTGESQVLKKPAVNLKDESSNGGTVCSELTTTTAEGRENCTSLDVTINHYELVDSSSLSLKSLQRKNYTQLGKSMIPNATYGKPVNISSQGEYVMDLDSDEEQPSYEIVVPLQHNSSYYSVARDPPAVHVGETTNNTKPT